MSKLKELDEASIKTQAALDHANKVIDEEIRLASNAIRVKHAEYKDALIIANNAARREYIAERNRVDIENANPPYPVGTKMFEWVDTGWRGCDGKALTGRVGLIEVWTPDAPKPSNVEYGPYVGKVVIRLLKADGTPSLKYVDSHLERWLPEGKKPKGAK